MKTKLLLIAVSFAFVLSSCKKDNTKENLSYSIEAAEDNSLSSALFTDALKQVENAHLDQDGSNKGTLDSSCAIITITQGGASDDFIWKAKVDFGTTGCLYNGRTRKGIIYFTTTGLYRDSATVVKAWTDNYYVDDYKLEGTKTVTNMGRNSDGELYYKIEVNNGVITSTVDSSVRTWQTTRYNTWVEGESTIFNWWDDEYDVSGSATGVTHTGKHYSISITQDLRVKIICKWIQDGNLDIIVEDVPTISVDYGVGSLTPCDNQAKATVDGQDYTFYMN
jgi:hypothetical protein